MSRAKIIGLVFVLLVIHPVFAFNCGFFDGFENENCIEIVNSDYSEDEQDELFANLLYGSTTIPDFDLIREWNLAQELVKTNEAKRANGYFAKNVWLDQLALMPSVIENGVLYSPGDIEVLTGFGYNIVIPDDYESSGYPITKNGDCRTEYDLKKKEEALNVYSNGDLKGNGKLVSLKISDDSVIQSELIVNVDVEIEHYKWDSYCCRRGEHGCTKYCHKCEHDGNERKVDRIKLIDSAEVKLHNKTPVVDFEVNDVYYGTTKGQVRVYNYSTFELRFQDSSLKRSANVYEVSFSGKPNHIATLQSSPYPNQIINNIRIYNNTFYVGNADDCKLISRSHFNTFEQECDLTIHLLNESNKFEVQGFEGDIFFAFSICIFLFVNYVIYKTIMHYWGRFR
ncbi:hypothetical protein KY346_00040 [Candidatus Woesearchaeota archaeon]|nr:hypothetical protein [Candidatus Woesearchaeota archaeon]